MFKNLTLGFIGAITLTTACTSNKGYGELIFEDRFERVESQEKLDEPGNQWTTSSNKTAYGEKQVDLRDGYMHIYTHKKAWHATSVRHSFEFKDGSIGLKVKFYDEKDSIRLNFTDMGEKSVHAGHLFTVEVNPSQVKMTDLKTGIMNKKIAKARKAKKLTKEQQEMLKTKSTSFKNTLEVGKWHDVLATVKGDEVFCSVNDQLIGSFKSPGIAHDNKTLIRLLVPNKVSVDDVKIWRLN